MGKGGGSSGVSPLVQNEMVSTESALARIATQQNQNAQQLYSLTEPGMATAESFYSALASGDPGAIMRAIGPGAQQVAQATTGAKKSIMENAPAGGEKNLALEMADVNRGAQVGQMASGAYLNAPNALAQLAGQGVGASQAASSLATSGLSVGESALGNLGNLQIEQAKLKQQQKGASMGAFGSLVGDIGSVASSQQGGASWLDALAALG